MKIRSDCPGADLVTGMCICDDGYVMEGGQCIRKSNCGCKLEDGSRVPNGFSQMSCDCSIMCQCTDSYWNCNQHYCSGNTICQADPNNDQLGQCTPSGKGTIRQFLLIFDWICRKKLWNRNKVFVMLRVIRIWRLLTARAMMLWVPVNITLLHRKQFLQLNRHSMWNWPTLNEILAAKSLMLNASFSSSVPKIEIINIS